MGMLFQFSKEHGGILFNMQSCAFSYSVSLVGDNMCLNCILTLIWDAIRLRFRPGGLRVLPVPWIQT